MKRRDLIKQLENVGCIFIRHGGKHDCIKIQEPRFLNPFPDTEKLKSNLPNILLKCLVMGKILISAIAFHNKVETAIAQTRLAIRIRFGIRERSQAFFLSRDIRTFALENLFSMF